MLKKRNVLHHTEYYLHRKNRLFHQEKLLSHQNEVDIHYSHREKQNATLHNFVPGSLCIAYSISTDEHTKNSTITLHGNDLFFVLFINSFE